MWKKGLSKYILFKYIIGPKEVKKLWSSADNICRSDEKFSAWPIRKRSKIMKYTTDQWVTFGIESNKMKKKKDKWNTQIVMIYDQFVLENKTGLTNIKSLAKCWSDFSILSISFSCKQTIVSKFDFHWVPRLLAKLNLVSIRSIDQMGFKMTKQKFVVNSKKKKNLEIFLI